MNPDIERMYAKRRAKDKVIKIDGARQSVYNSRHEDVAALIISAAKSALNQR